MEGHAQITSEVLERYAADAVREVPGVRALVGRHSVRVQGDGEVTVEVHVGVEWGASIPQVGRAVQERVAGYLAAMADARPTRVDVVVDEVAAPVR
jgi:uncharacterized alkaline shock family protein YloU